VALGKGELKKGKVNTKRIVVVLCQQNLYNNYCYPKDSFLYLAGV
jgi:hypothetical protein